MDSAAIAEKYSAATCIYSVTRAAGRGQIPRIIIESIDNNWAENQIRPWVFGRKNWLFARSLHSGKRAAAIISLIQSARLNGHDPYAYLKGVLTRLQTQKAGGIEELLPHDWHTV